MNQLNSSKLKFLGSIHKKEEKENTFPNSDSSIQSDKFDKHHVSKGSHSQESLDSKQACRYHQNKKSKYKIVSVPYQKSNIKMAKYQLCDQICSKCAINLVAMGYKVEELDLNVSEQRQEEIQGFLESLQQTFKEMDEVEQSLTEKKGSLLRFCESQSQKVKEFYQKIVSALEVRLQDQLCILSEGQQRVISRYDYHQNELQEQHSELLQMYSDIEVNLDSIINGIEQHPYRQIMMQYTRRVQQVQQGVSRLGEEQLHLPRVYLKKSPNQQLVLGGLVEDSELEVRVVQTSLLRSQKNSNRTLLSPDTYDAINLASSRIPVDSQLVSQNVSQKQSKNQSPQNKNQMDNILTPNNLKQRSLSQPIQSNQKYIEILQKVNENQLKTNDYYSALLTVNKNEIAFRSERPSVQNKDLISMPNSLCSPQSEIHIQQKHYQSPKFK